MSCYECKHFSELKEPREVGGGNTIYGYCFRDMKAHPLQTGPGRAVYWPKGSGKDFCKERREKA